LDCDGKKDNGSDVAQGHFGRLAMHGIYSQYENADNPTDCVIVGSQERAAVPDDISRPREIRNPTHDASIGGGGDEPLGESAEVGDRAKRGSDRESKENRAENPISLPAGEARVSPSRNSVNKPESRGGQN
jgi:hypothetical protein